MPSRRMETPDGVRNQPTRVERPRRLSRNALQPLYELRDHAVVMAEFEAARCWGDYGYDAEQDSWWATDRHGGHFRFVIEPVGEAASRG